MAMTMQDAFAQARQAMARRTGGALAWLDPGIILRVEFERLSLQVSYRPGVGPGSGTMGFEAQAMPALFEFWPRDRQQLAQYPWARGEQDMFLALSCTAMPGIPFAAQFLITEFATPVLGQDGEEQGMRYGHSFAAGHPDVTALRGWLEPMGDALGVVTQGAAGPRVLQASLDARLRPVGVVYAA